MKKSLVTCKADGCNLKAVGLGYCHTHYMRYRRHGHTNPTRQTIDKCKVDGCDGVYGITKYGTPYLTKGYCMKHYYRFKMYGDASLVKSVHGFDVGNHPLYQTYHDMKGRCYNKKHKSYKHYGKRGIVVCDRWLGNNGFFNFINEMGVKPSKKHSLDRIDNNKGYCIENCRWATQYQQSSNIRTNNNVVGVYRKKNGWAAHIGVKGKRIEKWFKNFKDAVKHRHKLELEYIGYIIPPKK